MFSPDHSLLGNPLIIVPIGGNAILASEWQTLAVIFVAAIVVWLVIGAVLENAFIYTTEFSQFLPKAV